eukprot:TRINITY_DN30_c0_g2_i1.p1 TRINITY_DN30_c0_g2~~TRINITY_DN30_c0_g2_i1.p1  ORF type:complete len:339 (-),score=161.90 TRINITY_DN30_c0_g2_i1:111-1127(-)
MAELIRSGVTCINDMYFYAEDTVKTAQRVGLRATVGLVVMDFPTGYTPGGPDDCFAKAEDLVTRYNNDPLIKFAIAPHAPYTVCDDNLVRSKDFATRHNTRIHIHLHETKSECDDSASGNKQSMSCHRSEEKTRPLANLDRLGLLDRSLIAVHMTQLNDEEIARLGATHANVVHCPCSNLKLASGFCPVHKLLKAHVNVSIGTDSSASNNTLDMWGEMRTAALLAKGVSGDPTAVPAFDALRMATLHGAIALGIQNETGSLEAGKWADFQAVELNSVEMAPMYDVVSHLVYVADRHNVSDVWVAGKRLLRNRILTTINQNELLTKTKEWNKKLAAAQV